MPDQARMKVNGMRQGLAMLPCPMVKAGSQAMHSPVQAWLVLSHYVDAEPCDGRWVCPCAAFSTTPDTY